MSVPVWIKGKRLPAEPGSVAQARCFVADTLADHDLLCMLEDVRLAASELTTNAVLHAHSAFTITLVGLRSKVLVEVEDAVPEGEALARLGAREPLAMATGGRGLQIVSSLSQDWGVSTNRSGFKTVWAAFPRAAA
jgi:anti-sigma regulatory factor (Ser/Thr protein kinase)